MTRKRLALAAILLLGLGYATVIQSFSWNQTSHYDLIRALNQDQTTIDAYQINTGDKALYRGHYYSARAPGMALFSLPFYDALEAVNANHLAVQMKAQRGDDEIIWMIGLWANVLPGLILALLVYKLADRFEPGYGAVAAVTFGLGTLALPLSTLLFSHIFTACLAFAAFALMVRERDGPPRPSLLFVAGLLLGFAIAAEYPVAFAAAVLAIYMLSRRDTLNPVTLLTRGGAALAGAIAGVIPLLVYNHYAFHSWTHLAYSDVPRQKAGFFGIGAPSLKVLATLLFDSRGLLVLSPVLIMGAVGTVLLFRRGRRAEALTIGGICAFYAIYNSGYYLPFGGGFMQPRFLTTMVPFLAVPIALAFRRFPGPTVALAGVSITTMVVATITHPLVGYEQEPVKWARYLRQGFFQPTIVSAFDGTRGWGAVAPTLALFAASIALAAWASARMSLTWRQLAAGAAALAAWALFAILAPTGLGIDHQGLVDILHAGDRTALHKGFGNYPLTTLALIAAAAGLAFLVLARVLRNGEPPAPYPPAPATPGATRRPRHRTARAPALAAE